MSRKRGATAQFDVTVLAPGSTEEAGLQPVEGRLTPVDATTAVNYPFDQTDRMVGAYERLHQAIGAMNEHELFTLYHQAASFGKQAWMVQAHVLWEAKQRKVHHNDGAIAAVAAVFDIAPSNASGLIRVWEKFGLEYATTIAPYDHLIGVSWYKTCAYEPDPHAWLQLVIARKRANPDYSIRDLRADIEATKPEDYRNRLKPGPKPQQPRPAPALPDARGLDAISDLLAAADRADPTADPAAATGLITPAADPTAIPAAAGAGATGTGRDSVIGPTALRAPSPPPLLLHPDATTIAVLGDEDRYLLLHHDLAAATDHLLDRDWHNRLTPAEFAGFVRTLTDDEKLEQDTMARFFPWLLQVFAEREKIRQEEQEEREAAISAAKKRGGRKVPPRAEVG